MQWRALIVMYGHTSLGLIHEGGTSTTSLVSTGLNIDTTHGMGLEQVEANARSRCVRYVAMNLHTTPTCVIYPPVFDSFVRIDCSLGLRAGDSDKLIRNTNGVHPGNSGQAQIADALWAWLKYADASAD